MRHFNHIANDAILVSRPMPTQRSRWMLASAFESLRSYLDGSFSKGGRHSIADSSSGAANCPPVALPAYLPRRRSHQIASLRSTRFLYYRSVVNRQLFRRLASVPVATAGDGQASAAQSCLPLLRSFHISIHPSIHPLLLPGALAIPPSHPLHRLMFSPPFTPSPCYSRPPYSSPPLRSTPHGHVRMILGVCAAAIV